MSEKKGLEAAKAFRAKGLVDYAEGGVVSRTLVDTSGGTVTVFAFDQGQSLSEHTAPYDALVLVLEGVAGLSIGGESVEVQAGELTLMPADVPHAVEAPERFKMLLVMVRG
jgi:quercetin dioxygenase-like cupin family protein